MVENVSDSLRPLLSLADQKSLNLSAKMFEKVTTQAASPVLPIAITAEEARVARESLLGPAAEETDLLDIAESSFRTGAKEASDIFTGRERTNEALRLEADIESGVTPEGRQRILTDKTNAAVEAMAEASLAFDEGDFVGGAARSVEAIGKSFLAGPALLAESAKVVPEIAAGAALTATATGAPAGIAFLGKKIFQAGKAVDKLVESVQKVKKAKKATSRLDKIKAAAKTLPKTAGQMSVVTATITQSQIADFREKHGENPSPERIAGMYALNLSTMVLEGGIIKNLFVPKFKKEFFKEVRTTVSNMGKGSNLAQIFKRAGGGALKVAKAGGAEAGQEYLQTWAEIINTEIGPEAAKNFLESASKEIGNKNNKLQAKIGALLGLGAGGTARAAISAPTVVAGGAVDLTKATAKGAAKIAVGTTKIIGRGAQAVTNKTSLAVLNEEERAELVKEHGVRTGIFEEKSKDLDTSIAAVDSSTTIADLQSNDQIKNQVDKLQRERTDTTDDLSDPDKLQAFKDDLVSRFKADQLTLKTELETSNIGRVVKKAGENVVTKSIAKAQALLKDVPIEEITKVAKQYGKATVKAIKEIRSSTARGVIELGLREGTSASKTILEASRNLSVHDLERVTAVLAQKDTKLGRKLAKVLKDKKASLERFGQRNKNLTNKDNIPFPLRKVAKANIVLDDQVESIGKIINDTLNGTIADLPALEAIEAAVAAYKKSDAFKNQTNNALDAVSMAAIAKKLKRASDKIRKPLRNKAKKKLQSIGKDIKKEGLIPFFADTAVVKKTAELMDSETAKDFIAKIKKRIPDLPELQTEEGAAAFEKQIDDALQTVADTAQTVKEVVTGPRKPKKANSKIRKFATTFETTIKQSPEGALAAVDQFIVQLKANDVETRQDFLDLIEEFPGLAENVPFFKKLDNAYPTDIVTDEITDNLATEIMTEEEVVEQYQKDNPGCPI